MKIRILFFALAMLLVSANVHATIVEVHYTYAGIEYPSSPKMANAFIDKGDTVRFKWISGAVRSVNSTNIPSGTSSFSFTLDANNPTYDMVLNTPGWYDFSDGTITGGEGRVVCIDPAAAVRYYEFVFNFTSSPQNVVAATSDTRVQYMVDSLLQHPLNMRYLHIKGLIGYGNDGHNHNWSWHFIKNKWRVESHSEEACDGLPDHVEDNLVSWVELEGYFCPWQCVVYRELFPTSVGSVYASKQTLQVHPNPATDKLYIKTTNNSGITQVQMVDMLGRTQILPILQNQYIDVQDVPTGMYNIVVRTDNDVLTAKVLIGER